LSSIESKTGEFGHLEKRGEMTKKLLILTILLLTTIPALGQSVCTDWEKRYNGPGNNSDIAYAIAVDGCGNIYVTGASDQSDTLPNTLDYATISYDCYGNQLWVKRYNGPDDEDDLAQDIAVDDSGNVYVTGISGMWVATSYQTDYATIKYDSSGNELWVRRYNGPGDYKDNASAIAVDGYGNVIVTGRSYGIGTDYDYATVKYYPNGDTAWVRRYDGPANSYDSPRAITIDGSANVYVTGKSPGNGTFDDYATIKYDSSGNQLWIARYNGPLNAWDNATAMTVDNSGNIYVTGGSDSCRTGTRYDYATIKYDSLGNEIWIKRYNGSENGADWGHAIAVDHSGNVYVTGDSRGTGTQLDYATIKYDSSGNEIWVKRYNGPDNTDDKACAIALDGSGNLYITGWSRANGTFADYTTIKYDSSGTELWLARYNGPIDRGEYALDMVLDLSNNIYVTGYSEVGTGRFYNTDYATVKYVQSDYICGDVNDDGIINLSDVIYLADYYLKSGNPPPDPRCRANANGENDLNLSDVIYIANYKLKGGPPPQDCGNY